MTAQRTPLHAIACCMLMAAGACSDGATPQGPATGGMAGMAGMAVAGSAGMTGMAGDAGVGRGGGAGGGSAPSGTVQVLTADPALRGPTTAAIRGGDLWVVNGQLSGLFGGSPPTLPFQVVSVPLAGGPIGASAIDLPGDMLYPEGIAAAGDGTLYVGSIGLGTIVKVPAGSTSATVFIPAGVAERGVVGLAVDETRGLLWFCDSSPIAATPGAAIVGVSLADATEVVRHAMPDPASASNPDAGSRLDAGAPASADAAGADAAAPAQVASFCNDLIVDPTGNIFATDSSGRIFRVPAARVMTPDSAEVWLAAAEISPPSPGGLGANGIALVGGSLIIASNGLVEVDPTSDHPEATLRTISLTRDGAPEALCGPDGLEAVPGSSSELIAVENGSCNPPSGDGDRVVRITLQR